MKIKELEPEKRPREKALRFGLASLDDVELIALLIQSGNKKRDAYHIAKDILKKTEDLSLLFDLHPAQFMEIQGMGHAKTLQLLASVELCKRAMQASVYRKQISGPKDLVDWFMVTYGFDTQENFVAVYLNTKGMIISHRVLFKGTLTQSCVHPRDIFREAYLENACSVMVVHNHPSGDPTPSQSDIQCTQQIQEVSKMMGVVLLDHIIVGRKEWYSFKQHELLD